MRQHHRDLGISIGMPGPRGFIVRTLAARLFGNAASIASRPNVRDDRETPL